MLLPLPFLPSLLLGSTPANQRIAPKRLILLHSPNGCPDTLFFPGKGLLLPNMTLASKAVAYLPLTSVLGSLGPVLGTEFDAIRHKISVLHGFDIIPKGGPNHLARNVLNATNYSESMKVNHVTVDQVLARSAKVYAKEPRLRSLHLRTHAIIPNELSISKPGGLFQAASSQHDPAIVWDMLFRNSAAGLTSKNRTILDFNLINYARVLGGGRISKEDSNVLESHIQYLKDMQARLLSTSNASCQVPPRPPDYSTDGDRPKLTKQHMDLIVAAIRCDLTRVVTLAMGYELENDVYSFVPGGLAKNWGHHEISHGGQPGNADALAKSERMGEIHNWHAKQVAYLIQQLDSIIEDPVNNSTLLDNSLVVWLHSQGGGVDPHEHWGLPCLIAGGGGRFFKTGYYVDYRDMDRGIWWSDSGQFQPTAEHPKLYGDGRPPVGRPLNELLIGLMLAMGLGPEDWEPYNDTQGREPGFGMYGPNYPASNPQYFLGDRRSPPPFITTA